MEKNINYEILLNKLERLMLHLSLKLHLPIYILNLKILKVQKKIILKRFLRALKSNDNTSTYKILRNILKGFELNEAFEDFLFKKFVNFYCYKPETRDLTQFNTGSIKIVEYDYKLLILSFLLQNIGEFKLQLKIELDFIDYLNTNRKNTIRNLLFFIQINLIESENFITFITQNNYHRLIPKDLVELCKENNNISQVKSSEKDALFIGPMNSDFNGFDNHCKALLVPNPTKLMIDSLNSFNDYELFFFYRSSLINSEIVNAIKDLKNKPVIILEKNNVIMDFFRLEKMKFKRLQKKLPNFKFKFQKYSINYVTFNGINFYLPSIILNNLKDFKSVSLTGVSFFVKEVNYSPEYISSRKINENDITNNLEFLLNNYSNHNLIQNFLLLKKLIRLKKIIPLGVSSEVLSLSPLEYSSALEKNYGNQH